jgi:hypothetical protein
MDIQTSKKEVMRLIGTLEAKDVCRVRGFLACLKKTGGGDALQGNGRRKPLMRNKPADGAEPWT